MTKTISAQGLELTRDQSDLINKKLERIAYADDLILDLTLRVKEDRKFYFDTTLNFRWGGNAHVSADDFDFAAALNRMMDVLDQKIKKEKDKVLDRK